MTLVVPDEDRVEKPNLSVPEVLRLPNDKGIMPFDEGGWVTEFCAKIAGGGSLRLIVQLSKMKLSTVEGWLRKGRSDDCPDPVYEQFALEVDRARAYWTQQRLMNVQRAGDNGDWRAAMHLVETLNEDFQKSATTGDGNSINIALTFATGLRDETDDDAIDI